MASRISAAMITSGKRGISSGRNSRETTIATTTACSSAASAARTLAGSIIRGPETTASAGNVAGVPLRAVIADDELLLREGVARLLEEAGIEVVGRAADARICCARSVRTSRTSRSTFACPLGAAVQLCCRPCPCRR